MSYRRSLRSRLAEAIGDWWTYDRRTLGQIRRERYNRRHPEYGPPIPWSMIRGEVDRGLRAYAEPIREHLNRPNPLLTRLTNFGSSPTDDDERGRIEG